MQRIAGEIKSFSTDGWVAPKLSKRMDRFMLYMITAGKKALSDGGITEDIMDELDKRRCGVLIGSALGGMKVINFFFIPSIVIVMKISLVKCVKKISFPFSFFVYMLLGSALFGC